MTTNAVDILKKRLGESPERRQRIDEEKSKISAACLIYEVRKKAGLTQRELAAKVGTKQSVISRMESADYDGHTLGMIKKVADALDMNINLSLEPKNNLVDKCHNKRRLKRRRSSKPNVVACQL